MNPVMGVYQITNTVNGHIYIGSSVNVHKRWNEHKWRLAKGTHHSAYLQRAWNKYGESAFEFTVLCQVNDTSSLLDVEQKYLDECAPDYNICPKAASRLGSKASEATKEKMRLIGAAITDEQRAWRRQNLIKNAVPAAANRVRTEADREWSRKHYQENYDLIHAKHEITCEQCGNVFVAEKGRFCSGKCKSKWRRDSGVDNVVKNCLCCGKEFTANKYENTETCSKSCGKKRSHSLNPMTIETRKKISDTRKYLGFSGSKNAVSIPVNQFSASMEFLATFASIAEAKRLTGIDVRQITSACKNIYKTAGGYLWRYADKAGN